ncbi:MAG TPA: hypothetical protein VMU08_17785 [Rhizomicrobium sp.]|nr:hypothetical protein [Rhizomicrobium sp.]
MKKIICAVLALTLLGSTAAQARGWGGNWHGGGWHGGGWHHHGNADWAIGLGLGLFALGVIGAAESAHARDQYYRDRDAYYREHGGDGAYDNRDGRDGDGPPPDNRHYEDDGGY